MDVSRARNSALRSLNDATPVPIKRWLKRRVPVRYYKHLIPEWHRRKVGGYWSELGQLQFDFLVEHGLQRHHHFLDVGCGSLRGGVHFIRYLEPRHYVGIDQSSDLLEAAREVELKRYELVEKEPHLVEMDNFDFKSLGRSFNFALAQSVFTHLPLNSIIRCVMSVEPVLVPGGKFFATFFENPQAKFNLASITHPGGVVSHFDRDLYHYDFGTFEWICEGTRLHVEYLGDWDHPRSQKMIVFTRQGSQAR